MPFLGRVARFLRTVRAAFDSAPRPIADVIFEMSSRSGRVTRSDAMSVAAVQRGRNTLCSIATLPLVQYAPDGSTRRSPFLDQIDPDVANVVTLAQTVEDLIFEGVSWWRITAFDWEGFPYYAQHIEPGSVSVTPPINAAPLPSGLDPREGVVWINGVPVGGREIIRFDSPNPGVLNVSGRVIRRAILLDKAAALYSDNPRPLDYFTPTEGSEDLDDDEIAKHLAQWAAYRKRRATGWIPSTMQYKSVDQPSPAELQLVQLQAQARLDVANALGLDPEDLGVNVTSRTYSNAVDRRRDRINDVLSPYMLAITQRLSMGDVTKRGYCVEFLLTDYLKSNPTERANVQKTYIDAGVLDPDEVRAQERYGPRPSSSTSSPAPITAQASITPQLASSFQFDAPSSHSFTFAQSSFTFDVAKRTVEGLALPFDKVAEKYGLKFRFDRNSLEWGDVSRVKITRDHMNAEGVAVEVKQQRDGYFGKGRIARGASGDELLALAEDGVYDGMSVGVDFDLAADTVPDPQNEGVLLVRRATLREIAITALPAFDDARLTKVAASKTGGSTMDPCTSCGQVHAAGVACSTPTPTAPPAAPATPAPVMLTLEQVGAMFAAAGIPMPGQRQVVNPVRPVAVTSVNEPEPYAFDGRGNLRRGPGGYDFSTDVIAGLKDRDSEALARAEGFIKREFDRLAFVNQADVATLNPNKQRPDLYVDQQDFTYPMWDAINKGTVDDATPFVLPKFSSSSGLVGTHTENVEPTPGTFVATAQTITPTPTSGKVEISREAWDQGGNPQMSGLIWRQMVRGWFEGLESATFTFLDALGATVITITTAAADAALEASITSQLAPLQFVRGGFRMRDAFAQVDLYKALVAAKDTNGRKLFPIVNPQNSSGFTSELWAGVMVGGLVFKPAWATAATSINSANSFLFDRGDVSGWATSPSRLTFDNIAVAKVHLGIWGYKALACTDLTGVRKLAYDPV